MITLITGGTIVTDGAHFEGSLLIEKGIIQAILPPHVDIEAFRKEKNIDQKDFHHVDADGCYIVPGGIDPHTHFDLQQSPKYRAVDDFYDGGVAAACGGTTTILDHMAFGTPGCPLTESFETYAELAERCPIDYAFHGVFQRVDEDVLSSMRLLIKEEGCPSYKAYTTYGYPLFAKDFLPLMKEMKASKGILTVHAESDAVTKALRENLSPEECLPIGQAKTRPNMAESSSIAELLGLAHITGDSPLYIVHLSAAESLEEVKLARREGQRHVYVETCTQYLLLTDEKFEEGGPEEGIKYILAPPLRKRKDNEALWEGIAEGHVQTVGTDHCPFYASEKVPHAYDFRSCPGGIPGVEERMALLFSEGVQRGRISLEQYVDVTSTNAAKIFGLYPKKGTLRPGSDGDVTIIDPSVQQILRAEDLHSKSGFTPYEGMTVRCQIRDVFLRGKHIAHKGNFLGERAYGEWIHRERTVPYDEIVKAK